MERVYDFIKSRLPEAEEEYHNNVGLISRWRHRNRLTTIFLSEPIFSKFERELTDKEKNDQSLDGHFLVDGVIVLDQTHPKAASSIVIDVHGHYPTKWDPVYYGLIE